MESQDHIGKEPSSPPPVSIPPVADRRASYTALSAQDDLFSRIVPTKNKQALPAYYFGVAALIPCLGLLAAPPAIVLGMMGLRACNATSGLPGKAHAISGIVMGIAMILLNIVGILLLRSYGP